MRMINSLTSGGFERWFNLTVVNISEEDADDYTCVGVNAGAGQLLIQYII